MDLDCIDDIFKDLIFFVAVSLLILLLFSTVLIFLLLKKLLNIFELFNIPVMIFLKLSREMRLLIKLMIFSFNLTGKELDRKKE